jgi:hypothetical protein
LKNEVRIVAAFFLTPIGLNYRKNKAIEITPNIISYQNSLFSRAFLKGYIWFWNVNGIND